MNETAQIRYLKIALVMVGLACFAVYPLSVVWPSGWAWHAEGQSSYLQMIVGIYATLGAFLLIAAHHPLQHLSLIWFGVWSSLVHGGIMAIQSLVYPEHRAHLLDDVPVLFVAAAILAWLTPRQVALTRKQA
jgi:hypothetical protein